MIMTNSIYLLAKKKKKKNKDFGNPNVQLEKFTTTWMSKYKVRKERPLPWSYS
jgi:hypothetical protein